MVNKKAEHPENLSFGRSVTTLLSGSTFGMAIGFFAQLLLIHFYQDADFGIFATFQALAMLFSVIVSLRFEDAIALPKNIQGATNVMILSILTSLAFCTILQIIFYFFSALISFYFRTPPLQEWLWLVPLTTFLSNTVRVLELYLTRIRSFRQISLSRIIWNLGTSSGQLIGGILRMGTPGLIGGALAGRAFSLINLSLNAFFLNRSLISRAFQPKYLVHALRRYQRFAFFAMPAALLNALPTQLIILGLAYFFDEAIVGVYDRGYRYLVIPAGLIGNAISSVYLAKASEALHRNGLNAVTEFTYRRMLWIMAFPTLAVMLAGPQLYAFVLQNPHWAISGQYAQWIAPWLLFITISSSLTPIFDLLQRQRLDLFFSLSAFVFQVLVLWFFGTLGNPLWAVAAISISGIFLRLIQLIILFRLAETSLQCLFADWIPILLSAIPGLVVIHLSLYLPLWGNVFWGFIMGFLFFGIGFYLYHKKYTSTIL
ncbi:MAG: oligosaccharide flippase family protein [Bacteroidetes Order II. Incertae sedis bacterium]|nr:oligosaccharide flippase family protein [Bacteroidetes Order II. bacterium]